MIRIIVQRKTFNTPFWGRLKCIRKQLKVSWLDAYFFVRKIREGHGVILTTTDNNLLSNEQLLVMDKLQGNLHQYFSTTNRIVSAIDNIIPLNNFTYLFFRMKDGIMIKVYISDEPGFIDSQLNIYK